MRALPAGVLALLIGRHLPQGRWWWRALVLGTLNIGAFFPLLFLGAERLPGGVAAVLGAIGPLVVALLSRPLLGRVPTVAQIAWGIVAVFGVGLITINGGEAKFDTVGLVAGLVGAAFMATGTVLGNRWGRPVDVVSSPAGSSRRAVSSSCPSPCFSKGCPTTSVPSPPRATCG